MKIEAQPAFNRKRCMACRICVDACPVSCIDTASSGTDRDPHGYPFLTDEAACISCNQCAETCPVEAVSMQTAA